MPGRAEYPVWGVDVSSWQGDIDWKTLADYGMQFAYIKSTEGKSYTDSRFAENLQGAMDAGLYAGAYHFLSSSSTGAEQAQHFIDTVPNIPGTLVPVIDIEVAVSAEGIDTVLTDMIDALTAHYGAPPVLYVTYDTYDAFVKGKYPDCPIWIRDILSRPDISDNRDWILWQYSNRGALKGFSGKETYIDLNVLNGGMEELISITLK